MTLDAAVNATRHNGTQRRREFGIELDLGRLGGDASDSAIQQIRDAVLRHGFAVLRDQRFNDPALLAFGRRLGTIEDRVIKYSTVGPSQMQDATLWHHHSHCTGRLDDWIVYYTPAVPDSGGSIEWFDAEQWFAQLDDADRQWARQQRVRHDFRSVAHAGIAPVADPAWHPLVTTRRFAGGVQEALYMGAHAVEMEGAGRMDGADPDSALHRILEHAKDPALCRLHDARAHDVVIWDMRMVAHRGHPWSSASLRVIHEVMIREVAQ